MTIWVTYFCAALTVSCVFIAAGWRSRRVAGAAAPRDRYELPFDPLWDSAAGDASQNQTQSDADQALRLALKRIMPLLRSHSVQADIAVAPGLLVRMRMEALAALIEELLAAAVHAAPATRLLLTASMRGDHVEISTNDDVPVADSETRMASVRGLMQRVSIRGGSLHIAVQPNEGTTMTLRLAAGSERRASRDTVREAGSTAPAASRIDAQGTVAPG
jgi:hypothetical protein